MRKTPMHRLPVALVVGVGLGLVGSQEVLAAGSLVSSTNPYASCTIGGGPGAFNYKDSEVEPWVAVNPHVAGNVIGSWQQDRWSDGGAHGLVASFSTDGGATWPSANERPLPFDECAPGGLSYERASDTWVSIGPDGNAYTVSISFNESNPFNAVAAATSADGGNSWSRASTIQQDNNSQFFNDKESVTADPVHAGTAYVVWDRLQAPNGNPRADLHTRAFTGPAMFSKTTNGGASWSVPKVIVPTGQHQQTIGNVIVVDPTTDTLYDFFNFISNPPVPSPYKVEFIKSTDGGGTWTAPHFVNFEETVGVSDPNNLNPLTNAPPAPSRTADIIPEPAINPSTGQVYAVWQDARFNSFSNDEALISTSSDGGGTWSAPVRVNNHTGEPAYDPAPYVDSSGTVGVSYYQWGTTVSGNEPTKLFIKHSTSAGSSSTPPTFGSATTLTGPFNNLAAPVARGYFLGDYEGISANSSGFIPFNTITNCSDGSSTTEPSCRAIQSVLSPTNRTPTDFNSTDVFAFPAS
jgi:hypothetical protein